MTTPAIVAIALAVLVTLSCLSVSRGGRFGAPGFGAVGGGTGMIAVGGVLVAKGHDLTGILLDVFGVIAIWAAFQTWGGE